MTKMNLPMKQNHGQREKNGACQRGGNLGRGGVGAVVNGCKLLYKEWINKKILLYSVEK